MFYYLLAGANGQERESLNLSQPQDFFYLNQVFKRSVDRYSTGRSVSYSVLNVTVIFVLDSLKSSYSYCVADV